MTDTEPDATETEQTELTEFESHDVVDVTIGGESIRGVVRSPCEPATDDVPEGVSVLSIELPDDHGLGYGAHDGTDAFVDDGTAFVVETLVEGRVGHPDTSSIHPKDYDVSRHLDALDDADLDRRAGRTPEFEPAREADVDEGDHVTVRYESARGTGDSTVSGFVTATTARGGFWIDTGDEFDDGRPKTYKIGYRTVQGDAIDGSRYSLTPRLTTSEVMVRIDEPVTDGGRDEGAQIRETSDVDPRRDDVEDEDDEAGRADLLGETVTITYDPIDGDYEHLRTGYAGQVAEDGSTVLVSLDEDGDEALAIMGGYVCRLEPIGDLTGLRRRDDEPVTDGGVEDPRDAEPGDVVRVEARSAEATTFVEGTVVETVGLRATPEDALDVRAGDRVFRVDRAGEVVALDGVDPEADATLGTFAGVEFDPDPGSVARDGGVRTETPLFAVGDRVEDTTLPEDERGAARVLDPDVGAAGEVEVGATGATVNEFHGNEVYGPDARVARIVFEGWLDDHAPGWADADEPLDEWLDAYTEPWADLDPRTYDYPEGRLAERAPSEGSA